MRPTRYRILGRLEALSPTGQTLPINGARMRAVLGLLLLSHDRIVSMDHIVDHVWGDRVPASAHKNVQTYVWRLRRSLDPDDLGVLRHHGPGYVMYSGPDELDLDLFERHADDGERMLAAGDPSEAATMLRRALLLWRGPPLSDVAFARRPPGLVALAERHLSVLTARIEADLRCGQHGAVVGELRRLADEHPYQERFRAQLMVALDGCGRRAEALGAYADIRNRLRRDFGLEPGPELQAVQAGILAGDGRR